MSDVLSASRRRDQPNPLAGIVADEEPLKPIHPLTFNRVYSQVGGNDVFQVRPAVVHFSGFTVGQPHRATVRVVNAANAPHRMHIIPPTTPHFSATCDKRIVVNAYLHTAVVNEKMGAVPPGLSEDITIVFTPDAHRYYYDCVRVHTSGESIVIPIHAYPAPAAASFPRRLDLGPCAVGAAVSRTALLRCRAPIDVEYEVITMAACAEFVVTPSRGVLPAGGAAAITVEFSPTRLATSTLELSVRLVVASGGGVAPAPTCACTVTGAGAPGIARAAAMAGALAEMDPREVAAAARDARTAFLPHRTLTDDGGDPLGGSMGAGGGDAFTRSMARSRKLDAGFGAPITLQVPPAPVAPAETLIDGIWVPTSVGDPGAHAAVAYVLMQQPGKLRVKELQVAIAGARSARAAEAAAVAAGLAVTSALDPLDDASLPRQLKAALFDKELLAAADHERTKDLSFGVAVGSDPMPQAEVDAVIAARATAAALAAAAERDADIARSAGEAAEAAAAVHPACGDPMAPFRAMAAAEAEAAAAAGHPSTPPPIGPRYDPFANDVWRMRAQVLERFVQAARKVVFRFRAAKRLIKIQALFHRAAAKTAASRRPGGNDAASLAAERERVAALVAHEFLRQPHTEPAAGEASSSLTGAVPLSTTTLTPDAAAAAIVQRSQMRSYAFPSSSESATRPRKAMAPGSVGDMHAAEPLALVVPLRFEQMGYREEKWAAARCYVPLAPDQPLMRGAEEEVGGARPMGVVAAIAGPMPAILRRVTHDRGALVAPSDDGACAESVPSWGIDPGAMIRPRMWSHHDSLASEVPGWSSCRALEGKPSLCDAWLPRREGWEVRAAPLPALLTGPSAEDDMPDPEGQQTAADRDASARTVDAWPTLGDVKRLFPLPGESGALIMPGTTDAGGVTDPDATLVAAPPQQLVIPRQRRQLEVDGRAKARRTELEGRLPSRVRAFNALVRSSRAKVTL